MSAKTVFISYSHDSPQHSARVLQFSDALRGHGIDTELDQYHVRPPKGWPHWCEEQLRPDNSEFVLMVCTETYLKRVQDKVSADEGRGVFWEGGIIYDYLYDAKENTRFIPVLFSDGQTSFIPPPIRNHTRYRIEAFDITDEGYQSLYRELTGQPLVTKPPLGDEIKFEVDLASAAQPLEARTVKTNFPLIDISRIIKYAPAELIGRERETNLLNDVWARVQNSEPKHPHILTFVALGGEGKTSLVAKWAADLAYRGWPACDAAFAWSFYSQGTRAQTVASSDLFFKEALIFFGDEALAGSAQGAFDKGRRLAQLVGERRSLFILDGLEPLQYPPVPPMDGKLKDEGIAELLKGLAATNYGLCVVTTRYSIPDLRAFIGKTLQEEKITRLSTEAGVALLQSFNVKGGLRRTIPSADGSQLLNEFEKLVEDVKGHALTLNLLGSYLRDSHAGDIRQRDLIKLEEADVEEQGGHAFHVMDAYVKSFESSGKTAEDNAKGRRALALLRLLGLFDRPATANCLNALWKDEAIAGLTDPLIGISEAERNMSLRRLADAKLLTVNREEGSGMLLSLDAHPLIREYFAQRMRRQQPEAWRAAHRRVYEHLCASTKEGEQPTLEDLQPLYQAVVHGCLAELQQEACDDVYRDRISRGEEAYVVKKLGAFGSDLAAVSSFFKQPWSRISCALTKGAQAWLLHQAAFRLRALGRLHEALEPMRAALEMRLTQENWKSAAVCASNLSELEMTLADVDGAVTDAERAVSYADKSGDAFQRWTKRSRLADGLHQAGRLIEAETRFREAEQLVGRDRPSHPLLYSTAGFMYCDLLLVAPERAAWLKMQNIEVPGQKSKLIDTCRVVSERAAAIQKRSIGNRTYVLLDMAVDHLTLGRAGLYAAILEKSEIRVSQSEIESAVSGLRCAGRQDHLPRGLLTRAWLRSVIGEQTGPESAEADLDEAWEIAERGPMKLFMADIHLYRARLFHGVKPYPWTSPHDDLAAARKLIEQCGYWRRKEELEDAEAAAKDW